MIPELGANGMPGITDERVQESHEFLRDVNHVAIKGIVIAAGTEDPDHVDKEFVLQPGLVLVRIETGPHAGKFTNPDNAYAAPYDDDIVEAVILDRYINTMSKTGPPEDKQAAGVWHGRVDRDQLFYGASDPSRIEALEAAMKLVLVEEDV